MNSTQSELKIRQLTYYKQIPQTAFETHRENKLSVLEHKLGKTKRTTNFTDSRPYFENFMTKTDQIQSFGFRLPFLVENHENPKAQIHFLEVFTHSQSLIEVYYYLILSYIRDCRNIIDQLKQESKQIKEDMENMKIKTNQDLDGITDQFKKVVQNKTRILKEDYVTYSTESFRLNKEISKLTKEKMQLEMDSMNALNKISRLEMQMQGVQMEMVCDDEEGLTTQLNGTFGKRYTTH